MRLNELMARNTSAIADPQGEFDEWIELANNGGSDAGLDGHFLSDDRDNPRKWEFPAGTVISAGGTLLVWADEDGKATPGLHANFKLSRTGETISLVGPDADGNPLLDSVTLAPLPEDVSYGRVGDEWQILTAPTPGAQNL